MEKLVYLHIEKSAGTSQRALFDRELGAGSVFWYGRESNAKVYDERESEGFSLLGGHRIYPFYNRREFGYLAVVRDPVERVVSLFHYLRTARPVSWKNDELDESSLKASLEKSERFRTMITGGQCRYLSGHSSFEKTLAHLQGKRYVVATFTALPRFNTLLCDKLGWHEADLVYKNVGERGYRESVDVDKTTRSLIKELVHEDQRLYDHLEKREKGLLNTVVDQDWDQFLASSAHRSPAKPLQLRVESLELDANRVLAGVVLSNAAMEGFAEKRGCYVGFRAHGHDGAIIKEARASVRTPIAVGGARYFLLVLEGVPLEDISELIFGVVDVEAKCWMMPAQISTLSVNLARQG